MPLPNVGTCDVGNRPDLEPGQDPDTETLGLVVADVTGFPVRFADIDMTLRKTAGRHSVPAFPVASGISECLASAVQAWNHGKENGVVSVFYDYVRHRRLVNDVT